MPRQARIVGAGYPHHIVQRGNNRQTIFFDDEDRRVYLEFLKKASLKNGCVVHAYCLMPNHVHLLAVPQLENSFAKVMQKLSLKFTQYINKKYNRTGRLWESRFHSSIVDKDDYLWPVCRYIERNPVRANIVALPTEYNWSSARCNVLMEKNNFIVPIWQTDCERRQYAEFLNKPDSDDEMRMIWTSTIRGKPIGTKDFIKQISEKLGFEIISRPRGRPCKVENK